MVTARMTPAMMAPAVAPTTIGSEWTAHKHGHFDGFEVGRADLPGDSERPHPTNGVVRN